MSLNKFTAYQTGYDLKLEIGGDTIECNDLIVLNSITLPPNVFVDNLTVNDSLTIVCDDTSTYNLTTATNGNLGDILSTDGAGNLFWTTVPLPPLSGITYSGTLPAEVGRVLQISNPTATTCTKTSILENISDITVEKPIQLTTNKITSTYVPLNNDDLVNKLYADNLGVQGPTGPQGPIGPTGPQGATGQTGQTGQGGQVLYLNYSESTIPSFLPLNTTQLSSIIGGSFTNAAITYNPSQNLNTSLLVTVPNLSLPQAELTFTINAVTTQYPIAQFAIDKIDLTGIDTFINPGIWQMNIYAQADTNADENKIRLKFYLLGRKTIGGLYDNLVPAGSDNLYILDHLAVRAYELNMYIANPIDITIYDLFQIVIVAENINSSPHTSLLYFQSSTTYSHVHTNVGILSNISIDSVGTGTSLISSNISPNFYLKSLVGGTDINITNNINEITLTNSSPASLISLTNSGSGNSIINSSINPSFTTKGIVAGTNITITDSGTDLTINSSGGGISSTFWDFLPVNISNKGSLLNNSSYFNMGIVPNNITINTIRFFLPDINPSNNIVRFALYKGPLTSGNTCILQAQSVFTIPTNAIGLQIMTFTAEIGKSLTFNTGDLLWLTFNGSLILSAFFGNGSADIDNSFLVSTNYNAGFPAFLTTALGRVQTNIRVCGLFNS